MTQSAVGWNVDYLTLIGGSSGDYANAIAVDANGDAYIGGSLNDVSLAYAVRLHWSDEDSALSRVYEATYAGADTAIAYGIAVDANQNAYLVGSTQQNGDEANEFYPSSDAFIVKFDPDGTQQWQRIFGGTDADYGDAVAVDRQQRVYLAGYTASIDDFPTISPLPTSYVGGGGEGGYQIGFAAMLTGDGTTTYRTLLAGDAGNDVAVDSAGQVFIASGRYDEEAGNVGALITIAPDGAAWGDEQLFATSELKAVALDASENTYIIANDYIARVGDNPLPTVDTDGDALPDYWEMHGYRYVDANGEPHLVDLPAMGADPLHKDVFVEIDWMGETSKCSYVVFNCVAHDHRPKSGAINTVITAFADAPVSNPDGEPGINLHVDVGPDSVMNAATDTRWNMLSQANEIPHEDVVRLNCLGIGQTELESVAMSKANLTPERRHIFHHVISAHEYEGRQYPESCPIKGPSGSMGGTVVNDSYSIVFVTLAAGNYKYNDAAGQAGTFMHELGHALWLVHGGPTKLVDPNLAIADQIGEGQNFKPNYLSVMNYAYQVGTLKKQQGNQVVAVIDYSRVARDDLDEAHLDEQQGIPSSSEYRIPQFWCDDKLVSLEALDWNCDGDTNDSDVSADVNRRKQDEVTTARQILKSFADWPYLKYGNGPVGKAGLSSTPTTGFEDVPQEITAEELDKIPRHYAVAIQGDGIVFAQPGTRFTYTLRVKNTGLLSGTYTITPQTASSTLGWMTFDAAPFTITLTPEQEATFLVAVDIPFGTSLGVYDSLTIRVQSTTVINAPETGVLRIKTVPGSALPPTPTMTATATPTNTPTATAVVATQKISPIVECVAANQDGTYTAFFGYKNPNTAAISIPIGSQNKFTPAPQNRGQPTSFAPGRTPYYPNAAFSVVFNGNNLVWKLGGRTATASRTSARCQ